MSESKLNVQTLIAVIVVSVILSVSISYMIIPRGTGEPGPQGPTGPAGPRGPQGLKGETYTVREYLDFITTNFETVKTWEGSSSITTELFYVPVIQIKITWTLEYQEYAGILAIYVYQDGLELVKVITCNDPEGESYCYLTPGNYALEFNAAYVSYNVSVSIAIS